MITKRALDILKNENNFIKNVNRDRQADFATPKFGGQKAGSQIAIRLPNDYAIRTGPTSVPQSTIEQKVVLTVAKQAGIDLSFSTTDLTLNIVDFSERFIEPAMNRVVGYIASDVISGSVRIPHVVHNVDVNNNTIAPTFGTFARAGGILDVNSVPRDKQRMVFVDPITMANSATSFAGYFNDQAKIGNQYRTAMVTDKVIGMDWMMDQTVPIQATANYGTPPTVNGAGQIGTMLNVSATTAPINAGDKFTLPNVYGVNRVNKTSTGKLRTFTIDAPQGTVFPAGTTSLPIYPSIIPALTALNGQGNYEQAFQTVTASPANGAAITFIFNAGELYRQNFVMHPDAVTLAVVPYQVPEGNGVIRSSHSEDDGLSVSMVTFYDGINGQEITRLDVLYGYVWQRPEFACVIGDQI